MMTFDRVLPELIRVCREDESLQDAVARYCIVRDVRGRVRLIIEPKNDSNVALDALQRTLVATLDKYFVAPIVSAATNGEVKRLAAQILDQARGKWPAGWPRSVRNVLGGADTMIEAGERWTGIERTIGKEAWLTTTPPRPPWPLVKGKTPPIVTFHSFKGGVGRTTLVASYAILLASRTPSTRVAVVDLDLEAPGVGSLFGVSTERGVLDVLVDHIATGAIDLDGASTLAQVDGTVDRNITVFPAGRVDDVYVQKLARLDFSSTEPGKDNPVGMALAAMLKSMRANFDVILLDARAGLHDLAGMSLHGLAHVDVLVFRGTTQNLAGLAQTLRTLGSRETTALVLVETLLPANEEELFKLRRERTRSLVYEMLCEHVYAEDDPPQLGDVGEPHDVVPVRRREWLDGLDSLKDHIADVLNEGELKEVARRIDDECLLDAEGATDATRNDEDAQ
jgi:MinD-like ATPase involved in chromosome partitioning or flagellar assembly